MAVYFIGLDCGGTRSRGVLADGDLTILARHMGGPGNPLTAGMEVACRSYGTVIRQLLRKARLQPGDVAGIGLGAAGAGRRKQRVDIERCLRRYLSTAEIVIETDGMIALLGATRGGPGIIVIAGTGSFVMAVDGRRKQVRAGGWGPFLGDEGSGATIGREAIQAVVRAEDGREPATALRKAILGHFRVRSAEDLVTRIYGNPPSPREYAKLWPLVLRTAMDGDRAARGILRRGGEELAKTAAAAAGKLEFRGKSIPLILSGGVLSRNSLLRRTLLMRLKEMVPDAVLAKPEAAPEIGALYLARASITKRSRARRRPNLRMIPAS